MEDVKRMDKISLRKIAEVFPSPITAKEVLKDGPATAVFEINEDWIFRFARRGLTAKQLQLEKQFLPLFEAVSPIPVPKIVYRGDDFLGYQKIPGIALTATVLNSVPQQARGSIAQDLGRFLTTLHGFSFSHDDLVEYPYRGSNFWEEVWQPIGPLLTEQAREASKSYFERAFQEISECPFTNVLTHADLGTSNILFDTREKAITGIIDFGDLCLHDPARDFNGILRNHGRAFTEDVLRFYEGPMESNFWDRIECYAKKQFFYVIFYAPLFGLEAHIPDCLAKIEKQFCP